MEAARAIIHVDMDAFYAAVEQRDCPELRGQAVVVGGSGDRGVVAAASYEARRFGIHSAMPSSRARELCPDARFVAPRMARYRAVSRQIFAIFERFTPLVEPLSLDEAFLDVTGSRRLHGEAQRIGRSIQSAIRAETGLGASVGIGPCKFVAKLASDHDKPGGFVEVAPTAVRAFLDPLPVRRMWGVGPKLAPRLEGAGFRSFRDLRSAPAAGLARLLGHAGAQRLRQLAAGVDPRPVVADRPEKSLSRETTLEEDLRSREACHRVLLELSGEVAARLRRRALQGCVVQVKIRTAAFRTVMRSEALARPQAGTEGLYVVARRLFDRWWSLTGPQPIRLLGVAVGELVAAGQGDLFGEATPAVDRLRDAVHSRFGAGALKPATLVRGRDRRRP